MTKTQSLIAVAQDAAALEQLLLESGGELNEALEAWLGEVSANLATKTDSYKYTIDRLGATSEMLRKRAAEYTNAARAMENAVDRLKDRIKVTMGIMGTDEVKGSEIRFKLQRGAPRLVIDEKNVPLELFVATTTYAPDKEKIKSLLADGEIIPGVSFEETTVLRTYLVRG